MTEREALIRCRDKFREYERMHLAKIEGVDKAVDHGMMHDDQAARFNREARAKADRNREMADMCDAALATPAPVAAGEGMVTCGECDPPGSGHECRGGECSRCGGKGRIAAAPAQSPVSESAEIERLRSDIDAAMHSYGQGACGAVTLYNLLKRARTALTNGGDNA